MKLKHILHDTQGTALVEGTLTLSFFILLLFGLVEAGLLIWTQVGLQYAVELAARCASVNTSLCGTQTAIKNVAVTNSLAAPNVSASTFTVTLNTTCGGNTVPGNLVTASYTFSVFGIYVLNTTTLTLQAKSCYPRQPS
jgi:Flp pilus assembly protein TadG